MADKNIKIQVIDKKATVIGAPVIVCGNSDYTATITFDDEWSLTGPKTARFVYVKDGKVQHEDVAFAGNVVAVPVLENVDFVDVGVFAGNLCTTTPARVPCRKSILCGSGVHHDPTPDIYDQIMKLFEDLAEKGAFGATEAQARQIEKNKQGIAQLETAKAEQTDVARLTSTVGQNSQDIVQLEATKAAQTDVVALAARMDTFTKLKEGSTTGDAELEDIRAGYDGTQYATAGDAVRGQANALAAKIEEKAKNIYPPVSSAPFVVMPGGLAEAMNVSFDGNGIYYVDCSLTEQAAYAGVGVVLGKKAEELKGKKVLLVFHETNMLPRAVYLSNGNAWGGTNIVRNSVSPTSNIVEIAVDESLDYGSNDLRLIFNFGLNIAAGNIRASFSVYISDVANGNMARYAEYALGAPVPELVPHSQFSSSSGFDNSVLKSFEQIVSQNEGYASFDGLATFDLTLENMNPSTGFAYTIVSINVKNHLEKCKGILLDRDDSVQYAFLTTVFNSWTADVQIAKLVNGYNDITNIDLSQYPSIYMLIGVAHTSFNAAAKRGKASVFCIPKSEVVASRLLNAEDFVKKGDAILYENSIVCWGDSLTAQGGWTTKLSELCGMPIYNSGTGGENIRTITARQGADVMMIDNITIPSEIAPVTLATYEEGGFDTELGYKAKPLLQGGLHVNPVSIGGILGTLKWTGSNHADATGVWTFTRLEAGEKLIINRPTAVTTAFDREKNNPHLMIIFMGTNGGFDSLDDLVNMHKLMIEHSKAKHTIVLGVTYFVRVGDVQEYEAKMRQAFGRYFISLRDYLSKYGLYDAGLTPSTEDITAMNKGEVPPQLLSDGVHYTAACKEVIGNMLYKKCCELNIF